MMLQLAVLIVAGTGETAPAAPEYGLPVTRAASFSHVPEMWGLRVLSPETKLQDLDESFVLYLARRARFDVGDESGRVYFMGGRQLVVDGELSEQEIADQLGSHACLCALEYENAGTDGDLQIAAGAYRLAAAPSVDRQVPGVVRVEFIFEGHDESPRPRLRRLVCWNSAGDRLGPVAMALPGFAKLTRKEHPGFADPPVDDRPIRHYELARSESSVVLADQYLGRRYYNSGPFRLDAPELVETAEPGLFTLLREIRIGRKLAIDYSNYYEDLDPYLRDLNRRNGISWRDPCSWP
jgi:hypothetical protein